VCLYVETVYEWILLMMSSCCSVTLGLLLSEDIRLGYQNDMYIDIFFTNL